MKIISERAKTIDTYLSNVKEIGKWPLEIAGEKQILPYYRFPIQLLTYNFNNGRLAMERKQWEEENKRVLDPTDPDDIAIIKEILLSLDEAETKTLKDDILKKGQMEPGVITFDGFVINGNRRMAVLEGFHVSNASGKWEYLEAIRLSSRISEKDLWRIEAGLQLSKDKVAEYHPVNELLKIKQGIEAKLKPREIAAAMYGRTEAEVVESLKRLQLIDNYLIFMGQEGNYGLIKKFGYHEYFVDIQKYVIRPSIKERLTKREISKRLEGVFALMWANIKLKKDKESKNITHWDIRKFGKIFSDTYAKAAYFENIDKQGKIKNINPRVIVDDFQNANEEISMKEQRDEPTKLIEKATKALERIDKRSKHFREQEVLKKLTKLSNLVHSIRSDLIKMLRDR